MCGLDSIHSGSARRDSERGFEMMRLLISSASALAGTNKERVSALVGGWRKPLAVSMAGATDIARPAAVATMKRAVAPRTREVRERGGGSVGFERVSIVGVVCGAFDNKVSKRSKQRTAHRHSLDWVVWKRFWIAGWRALYIQRLRAPKRVFRTSAAPETVAMDTLACDECQQLLEYPKPSRYRLRNRLLL